MITWPGGETTRCSNIRRYISRFPVLRVNIWPLDTGRWVAGGLEIVFTQGQRHTTRWESYDLLKWSLRSWRSLYGAPLFIEDKPCGRISFHNDKLKEE